MGAGETLEWAKPVFSESNDAAQPVLPVGYRAEVVDAPGVPVRRSSQSSSARRARPVGTPGPDLEQLAEALVRGSRPRIEDVAHRNPDRRVGATDAATDESADGVDAIAERAAVDPVRVEAILNEAAAGYTAAEDESSRWLQAPSGAAPPVRRPERDIADAPGIGDTMARRLREAGVATVAALAAVGAEDLDELAQAVGTFRGRLEIWVLAARDSEHASANAIG